MGDDLGAWDPWTPEKIFSRMGAPSSSLWWWIAGGHALDLFVGRPTRAHEDIDASLLRSAATRLRPRFPGWDLRLAHDGALIPWDGYSVIGSPYNSLWCRRRPDEPWRLQVMLEEGNTERWVCRRHRELTVPMSEVVQQSPEGMPYMAPQLQLFMKAKGTRPKDNADFEVVWPLLSPTPRTWLVQVMQRFYPGHPWLVEMVRG